MSYQEKSGETIPIIDENGWVHEFPTQEEQFLNNLLCWGDKIYGQDVQEFIDSCKGLSFIDIVHKLDKLRDEFKRKSYELRDR